MPDLTRDEAKQELERIVRESNNDAARISAIRQLREMWSEEKQDGERTPEEGFAELYRIEPAKTKAA